MTSAIATGTPFSGFAVSNIAAARTFYADVLGLPVTEEHGMLRIELTPDAAVLAYPKDDHVPATYTMLNLPVSDIDAAVEELGRRGVRMLRYDGMPQDDHGVMRGLDANLGPNIAWFTDPAGNIISVLQDS